MGGFDIDSTNELLMKVEELNTTLSKKYDAKGERVDDIVPNEEREKENEAALRTHIENKKKKKKTY